MEQDFRATQFVGSQADAEVMLEPPRAEVVMKVPARRGRRQENQYLLRFPRYDKSCTDCWLSSSCPAGLVVQRC